MMTDWHGLYAEGWQGEIEPDAFGHPAKFARALIRHIYAHALQEGWLKAGDAIIDPFAGVALGGLDAMSMGLQWVGVELEPRFVDLGQKNITLWNRRYAERMPRWGTARILQGDSRYLLDVLQSASACVSSPPYAQSVERWSKEPNAMMVEKALVARYGDQFGQLANLPATPEGLDAAISSPPYAASLNQPESANDSQARIARKRQAGVDVSKPINVGGEHSVLRQAQSYGDSDGQLAAMSPGNLAPAISSPPYAWSLDASAGEGTAFEKTKTGIVRPHFTLNTDNLDNQRGETFWSAARLILEQVYAILKPGGKAIWVLKSFVRDGTIVDFPGQWQALCEAVGFQTLHQHRAWLVEDRGTKFMLDGGQVQETVERKSFFRRLYESKGGQRIDWEVVLCMAKPLAAAEESSQGRDFRPYPY